MFTKYTLYLLFSHKIHDHDSTAQRMSSLANVEYELGREARRIVLQVLQHKLYVETHIVPSNSNVGQ